MLSSMTSTKSSHSLTGKLLFWVTLITAATLVAVVWASTSVAQKVLQRQILRDTESAAKDVAVELVTAQDPIELIQDTVWANKLLRRLAVWNGIRSIQIEVNSNGQTGRLETSPLPEREVLIEFSDVPLDQLMAVSAEEHLEVVVRQALPDGSGELSIRVVASTEVISVFLHVIYRNAIWMGLATWLVLVLTIAALIHRTMTQPLRQVASAMREVASGHLGEQVEEVSTAEVKPLVQSFNQMSQRLWDTESDRTKLLDEVEALNRDLKIRVEEASAALATAQADLARRDRLAALGELVGTIAHEVGTPLNSVLAHLDLLGEDLPEGADRQRLDVATREIERVGEVIRRYLNSTKAPTPNLASTEISELLNESTTVFAAQAAAAGISLTVECGSGYFPIDADLLAQIIRNLVSNALRAVEQGESVKLHGELRGKILQIEVVDTGRGMDLETKQRVFEPFYSARKDGSGTGLGMSIVRNAVASLGGEITIESEPDVGTRVAMRFEAPDDALKPTSLRFGELMEDSE